MNYHNFQNLVKKFFFKLNCYKLLTTFLRGFWKNCSHFFYNLTYYFIYLLIIGLYNYNALYLKYWLALLCQLATGFHLRVDVWRRIRQAFVQQSALVRKVDTELGALILLSNLNNLYFICLQLFLGIRYLTLRNISMFYRHYL